MALVDGTLKKPLKAWRIYIVQQLEYPQQCEVPKAFLKNRRKLEASVDHESALSF